MRLCNSNSLPLSLYEKGHILLCTLCPYMQGTFTKEPFKNRTLFQKRPTNLMFIPLVAISYMQTLQIITDGLRALLGLL